MRGRLPTCAAALAMALPSACYGPVRDPIYSPCLVPSPGTWTAETTIITDAWGKAYRTLVVSGTVTVPSGLDARLEAGALQKLKPRAQQFILRTQPALVPTDEGTRILRVQYRAPKGVGTVTIRCGDRTLAILPLPEPPPAT